MQVCLQTKCKVTDAAVKLHLLDGVRRAVGHAGKTESITVN